MLRHRISAAELPRLDADAILVATGSTPRALTVPGAGTVVSVIDAARHPEEWAGQTVIVVDDSGHFFAYAPAELLAAAGAHVMVITTRMAPGAALDEASLVTMLQRLRQAGIRFASSTALLRVDDRSVTLRDVLTGEERIERADAVVSGYAGHANDALVAPARSLGIEVHAIGDCVAPRSPLEAFREGNLVASTL